MSRSGYVDDYDDENGAVAMYRGVIASASRGKRGQRFFRELVTALDAMPEKRLIAGDLQKPDGAVCALGALGKSKGIDVDDLDTYDYDGLGVTFDIAHQLAQETMWENDDGGIYGETDEQRWARVRRWAAGNIRKTP